MTSNTPDFLPVIKHGCHSRPEDGACVMEYVSFITGEHFTDEPSCTPATLTRMAQYMNDYIHGDKERAQWMTPFISRLIGLGQNHEFDQHIANWFGETYDVHFLTAAVTPVAAITSLYGRAAYKVSCEPSGDGSPGCYDHVIPALAEVLTAALDEYDRFVGRVAPTTLQQEQADRVIELAGMIH